MFNLATDDLAVNMPLIKFVYISKKFQKIGIFKVISSSLKFQEFKVPGYVNSQSKAISLKTIPFIDKIKLILYLQVKNSLTSLTIISS
jgi:hypothetical protein